MEWVVYVVIIFGISAAFWLIVFGKAGETLSSFRKDRLYTLIGWTLAGHTLFEDNEKIYEWDSKIEDPVGSVFRVVGGQNTFEVELQKVA